MTRYRFDEQLEQLNQEMIRMGMMCETAIQQSSESLLAQDMAQAEALPALLEQIHQKNKEIENICLRLLLHQQPVARDLRFISSALKMVTDMERIGVQSADIAEIVSMKRTGEVALELPIREMAEAVIHMVTCSIDAYVERNLALAQEVVQYDDRVDDYFDRVKNLLIQELREKEVSGEKILDLLMIAKYLERIGDHAVNIAEWVQYSIGQRGSERG